MAVSYTPRQGQFLSFIHDYTKLNGRPPAETDMQRHFSITPPSVHQMVIMLEKRGLITRTPGQARSIRIVLPPEQLPNYEAPAATASAKLEFILGHWRIMHMDEWGQDFVNAEVEGYIRFDADGAGEFHFGYVHGWLDYELGQRDGRTTVDWSWEGNDEMDSASGRGSAVIQDEVTIKGKLSFHRGEKSGFLAVRNEKPERSSGMKTRGIS